MIRNECICFAFSQKYILTKNNIKYQKIVECESELLIVVGGKPDAYLWGLI